MRKLIGPYDASRDEMNIPVNGRTLRYAAQYILEYAQKLKQAGFDTAMCAANSIAKELLRADEDNLSNAAPFPGADVFETGQWVEKIPSPPETATEG